MFAESDALSLLDPRRGSSLSEWARTSSLTFLILGHVGITETSGELASLVALVVSIVDDLMSGCLLVRAGLTVLAAFGHGRGATIPRVVGVTVTIDGAGHGGGGDVGTVVVIIGGFFSGSLPGRRGRRR